MITEVGGTVGDIEILPFLEAIRQFRLDVGRENVCYVHVTLVPFIGPSGEQKTKPTQHSVTELRSRGIQPDAIVCRSDRPLSDGAQAQDLEPVRRARRGRRQRGRRPQHLRDPARAARGGPRRRRVPAPRLRRRHARPHRVGGARRAGRRRRHAACASGSSASTSACSTPTCRWSRSLKHGGFHHGAKVEIDWIQAEDVEGLLAAGRLRDLDGIVIPGGFGERGIEGKIAAAGYAREQGIPCLGLCLGLQVMTIDFARNVCGLAGANSTRVRPADPAPGDRPAWRRQRDVTDKGGTMRLGAYFAELAPGSQVAERPTASGSCPSATATATSSTTSTAPSSSRRACCCSGLSPDGRLVEFIELRRPPVLGRHPGPPRVQEPARPPGAAVPRVHRRRARHGPRAATRTCSSHDDLETTITVP